jgi:hypothetical protein
MITFRMMLPWDDASLGRFSPRDGWSLPYFSPYIHSVPDFQGHFIIFKSFFMLCRTSLLSGAVTVGSGAVGAGDIGAEG